MMTVSAKLTCLRGLVVDDNNFLRYLVKEQLLRCGFSLVDQAESGVEAIGMLDLRPDIIICDIEMAPMNGFEFLRYVRHMSDGIERTPVIFLTGDASADTVRDAINMHVDSYLVKPIRQDQLRKKVTTLLSRT